MKQGILGIVMTLVASSLQAQTKDTADLPTVSYGRIIRISNMASQFVEARHIDIWLPPAYDASEAVRLPVLYFQDGQNLFDGKFAYGGKEWGMDEWMKTLIESGKIRPCVVVGIWNTKARFREYMPQKAFDLLDTTQQGWITRERGGLPKSEAYSRFVIEELMPEVARRFRVLTGPQHTMVGGSSMGGLISLYLIVEHPELFGKAACISTHWPVSLKESRPEFPEAFAQWLNQAIPNNPPYALYFDFGTTQLDAWYEPAQLRIDAVLQTKAFPPGKLVRKKFEGAGHNEAFWNLRLGEILTFLLEVK